jgi:[ribosomal protein S18]-alanine N-acetyltransferase
MRRPATPVATRAYAAATGGGVAAGEVRVEAMRRRHLDRVMAIESVAYPKPWTEGMFRSELDLAHRGERHYVVALDRRSLVGYAGLMFAVDEAHVTNIAVDDAARRTGVGARLLGELVGAARACACVAMTLEVRTSNVAAQALYRRFGFVPAGVRQRYYENTEDAIVMWNHDLPTAEYGDHVHELCPVLSW